MEAGEKGEIRKNLLKLLRFIPKNRLFFESLTIFGIAAVILFSLFLTGDFEIIIKQVFASFGNSGAKEEPLITEEFLKAQFQETEQKLMKQGSYVYSFGYNPLAQINDSEDGFGGEEISGNILIQGVAFLSSSNPSSNLKEGIGVFDQERSGVIEYEVQPGDTPSYIAASFGVSTNTLLWENKLDYWSVIKPGQKLVILPISGVLHEVKKGETLAKIVKDYKGDFNETIAYNGLPADGYVKDGQKIIIPGGIKQIYNQPRVQFAFRSDVGFTGPYSGVSHKFPWGQCTWYIAQKRYIPWGGNAKQWLSSAQQYGFQTGKEPQVGAIVATNETWYGHVAYVEAVSGDQITISEMSLGRGKIGYRVLNRSDRKIRGYIY